MPNRKALHGVIDTRSLLRVWMAISAVWLLFWFGIASVALATPDVEIDALTPPILLLVAPPALALAAGVVVALILQLAADAAERSRHGAR